MTRRKLSITALAILFLLGGPVRADPMEDAAALSEHVMASMSLEEMECGETLEQIAEQAKQGAVASGTGHSLRCGKYDGTVEDVMKALDEAIGLKPMQEWSRNPGDNAGRGWMGQGQEWKGAPIKADSAIISVTAAIVEKEEKVVLQIGLIPQ